MNRAKRDHRLPYKDAIFFRPQKFVGGPGTPGGARYPHASAREPRADVVGGGTVIYVNRSKLPTSTITNRREEAGHRR